ncbi:MAG TPA: hypothetical protein VMP68_16940 [Candidatus Eisenbacteria bacterium]|nr:hypothetical protein [Candidatus Eisenbacteria bacterium]
MNWEQFILTTALGILSGLKKNPLNNPTVTMTLQHIVIDACEILGVQPPTFPPAK